MDSILLALVKEERITTKTANELQKRASNDSSRVITLLEEENILDEGEACYHLAENFGFPIFDVEALNPSFQEDAKEALEEKLIDKYQIAPLYTRGSFLFIATIDPMNEQISKDIRFASSLKPQFIISPSSKLTSQIANLGGGLDQFDNILDANTPDLDVDVINDEPQDEIDLFAQDSAPIVRYVNKLLIDAIKRGASDLHFEPYEKFYRVRYRTDGILEDVAQPPLSSAGRISARIKIMASLDTAERRVPQDGRIKLKIAKNRAIDFRVSTCPTIWGEKIVMRILDPESAKLGIDALGYEEKQKKLYLNALRKPQGLILITGPTGSGKTVSLYTGINLLNDSSRNISTAEDPVEINLPGINQVNINLKQGLDFPRVLRSFLRQDPDVILVGEIRDLETAEIAVKASQTGHLVLSTLHTNSAAETLTRLNNMGVPLYNIATSVRLIIAQRLARKLCNHCKKSITIKKQAIAEMGYAVDGLPDSVTIYEPVGCNKCNKGYKGRTGVYEVVAPNEEISKIILDGANAIDLAQEFRKQGFPDLYQSGLQKVLDGLTSLEEIQRITSSH